jgi:hypothetical protein
MLFLQDIMHEQLISQSNAVLLFLQPDVINFRSAARPHHHDHFRRSPAALLHSLRSRMSRHRSPHQSVSGKDTDSASHHGPESASGLFAPPASDASRTSTTHIASAPSLPTTGNGEKHKHSTVSTSVLPQVPVSNGAIAEAMHTAPRAKSEMLRSAEATPDSTLDSLLFQALTQFAKELYPSKKPWMSTAQRVASWLNLPRIARESLLAALRRFFCSEPAAARIVTAIKVWYPPWKPLIASLEIGCAQLAKELHPSKTTWMRSAQSVASELNLPRIAHKSLSSHCAASSA